MNLGNFEFVFNFENYFVVELTQCAYIIVHKLYINVHYVRIHNSIINRILQFFLRYWGDLQEFERGFIGFWAYNDRGAITNE